MTITSSMIDEGLKALKLETKMLGKIGTGEIELRNAMKAAEMVAGQVLCTYILTGMIGEKLARRFQEAAPAGRLAAVLDESILLDLPVTFFRLGYQLGFKAQQSTDREAS